LDIGEGPVRRSIRIVLGGGLKPSATIPQFGEPSFDRVDLLAEHINRSLAKGLGFFQAGNAIHQREVRMVRTGMFWIVHREALGPSTGAGDSCILLACR